MTIAAPEVSRGHAALRLRGGERAWTVRDLGSRNGSWHDGVALGDRPMAIGGDARIRLAKYEFRVFTGFAEQPEWLAELLAAAVTVDAPTISRVDSRTIAFTPIRDAGGIVTIERPDGARAQRSKVSLSTLDFALLRLLATRYLQKRTSDAQARGWVSSAELLCMDLPFGTDTPTSNNLRGAIKRIRDKCSKQGVDAVIESRQKLGYRLTPGFDEIVF